MPLLKSPRANLFLFQVKKSYCLKKEEKTVASQKWGMEMYGFHSMFFVWLEFYSTKKAYEKPKAI